MARRPTIVDVAKLAGVSKTTVARVINEEHDLVREETRLRVETAIEQLGYVRNVVAGSLRTDRTYVVALSIPDIMNPFWPEVARGVQDTVETEGFTVVMFNSDWASDRQRSHLEAVRRNRFDGLIINPVGLTAQALVDLRTPVVLLGSGEGFAQFDSVGSESQKAVHLALAHLYKLGHRRIGLIAGLPQGGRVSTRQAAYNTFHQQHDLPYDKSLVVRCDFTQEAGTAAMAALLRLEHPPTAVCAGNDILAIGALLGANAAGIHVPQQLSVIGMDDIYAASATFPPLTTIAKAKYQIGVEAARLLLQRIAGAGPPTRQHLLTSCILVERASTAPPPDTRG
ncbi:MAG: LacI family DNA-binding transcriptional regulator [Anaerolineae bacterium]|nr:LacI family DNA-binding transcriptional regulator [Anaerolineae bacterium]